MPCVFLDKWFLLEPSHIEMTNNTSKTLPPAEALIVQLSLSRAPGYKQPQCRDLKIKNACSILAFFELPRQVLSVEKHSVQFQNRKLNCQVLWNRLRQAPKPRSENI